MPLSMPPCTVLNCFSFSRVVYLAEKPQIVINGWVIACDTIMIGVLYSRIRAIHVDIIVITEWFLDVSA